MELHLHDRTAANTVTGYGDDYIEINEQRYQHPIFFRPEGPVHPWSVVTLADITADALITASGMVKKADDPFTFLSGGANQYENLPEVVLIGTGQQQHFLLPEIVMHLTQVGVGVECMDTIAAARTYNILMNEHRIVVAALLI